jgi:putative glutamine amidotransferase
MPHRDRPRIAILGRIATGSTSQREDRLAVPLSLTDAVWAAGGEPIVIAPARYPEATELDGLNWGQRLNGIQAVLMPGGADLDPKSYGQTAETAELYGVNAVQDRADLSLVHYALAQGLPLLTICRGTQVLNVALGGTLHQHVGDSHRNLGHKITLDPKTAFDLGINSGESQATLSASCHHHQALNIVASELTVLASSSDGIVEAVRVRGVAWAFGVQWHPEDNYKAEPANLDIFKALVAQAKKSGPGLPTEPTLFERIKTRATLRRGIRARSVQSR